MHIRYQLEIVIEMYLYFSFWAQGLVLFWRALLFYRLWTFSTWNFALIIKFRWTKLCLVDKSNKFVLISRSFLITRKIKGIQFRKKGHIYGTTISVDIDFFFCNSVKKNLRYIQFSPNIKIILSSGTILKIFLSACFKLKFVKNKSNRNLFSQNKLI